MDENLHVCVLFQMPSSHNLHVCFHSRTGPDGSAKSAFSLGPVNGDLLLSDDEEDRQAQGSDLVSSNSKWHKHTVKVLSMLKRNMGTGEEENDDDEEEPKPTHLSFDKLSSGVSRRTASSVFFELLQLKVSVFDGDSNVVLLMMLYLE